LLSPPSISTSPLDPRSLALPLLDVGRALARRLVLMIGVRLSDFEVTLEAASARLVLRRITAGASAAARKRSPRRRARAVG